MWLCTGVRDWWVPDERSPVKKALATVAALGSPIVWFASYGASFALSPLTCMWRSNAILWIVSLVAALLVAASGLAAWRQWNMHPDAAPGDLAMPRWLALSGVVLSCSFFVVILAQTIPTLLLAGCE
jgi:hypothetical protein